MAEQPESDGQQEIKESLKRGARSFREALTTTFSDLGEEIRKRVTGKGQLPPSA